MATTTQTFNAGFGTYTATLEDANAPVLFKFGAGISPSDIQLTLLDHQVDSYGHYFEMRSWTITFKNSPDVIQINRPGTAAPDRQFSSVAGASLVLDGSELNIPGLAGFQFADGTVWSRASVLAQLALADNVPGDLMQGSAGNDLMIGNGQHHELRGFGGNDTLVSGTGNEYLTGGAGSNVYRFAKDWGHDIVAIGDNDVIEFGTGIVPADIEFFKLGELPTLRNRHNGALIDLRGLDLAADTDLSEVRFSDGTTWSVRQLAQSLLNTTASDDRIAGSARAELFDGQGGNDFLEGHAGDDTLLGGAGNDTLVGGAGADRIEGGAGNDSLVGDQQDTFVFGRGFGQDTIVWDNGVHILLNDGITPNDVSLTRVVVTQPVTSYSRVIRLNATGDAITLREQGAPGAFSEVLTLTFSDGTVWTGAELDSHTTAVALPPSMPPGGEGADTLTALYDRAELAGLGGNDTYVVGKDTVVYLGGNMFGDVDTIVLGADVKPEDVRILTSSLNYQDPMYAAVRRSPTFPDPKQEDFLHIDTGGAQGVVTVRAYRAGMNVLGQFRLAFADGTVWSADEVEKRAIEGSAHAERITSDVTRAEVFAYGVGRGNDTIYAFDNTDTLVLDTDRVVFSTATQTRSWQTSNNQGIPYIDRLEVPSVFVRLLDSGETLELYGFSPVDNRLTVRLPDGRMLAGSELLAYSATPPILGGNAGDALSGTTSDDNILGLSGNDTLLGQGGNDTLIGGQGDDVLIGGAGDDLLRGAAGNDTLEGGLGDDWLEIGPDATTVVFNVGDGHDTIYFKQISIGGPVSLKLGAGITASDLQFSGGNDQLLFKNRPQDLVTGGFASIQLADGTVLGTAQIDALRLKGSRLNDTIYGGAGDDLINGQEGDDWLFGGSLPGNDTFTGGAGRDNYELYFTGKSVVHADGLDTLFLHAFLADVSLARLTPNAVLLSNTDGNSVQLDVDGPWEGLRVQFGDATLTGAELLSQAAGVKRSGGANKDLLWGQGGNDVLSGLAGNDTLNGSAGHDTLDGGAGNDILDGGLGNDRLIGGKGADTYLFNGWNGGQDTIVENDTGLLNNLLTPDLLKIDQATSDRLWLTKSGNNLQIAVIGTQGKVTLQDWYKGSNYQVEKITAVGDNKTLSASKVNALVNAMAKFSAPGDDVGAMPPATQAALSKILASSWT